MAAECVDDSGHFASPDFLATTIHWLVCIETPILVYGGYCIIFKTPILMKPVKWLMFTLHFWTAISDIALNFLGIFYILLPTLSGWGLGAIHAPGLMVYSLFTFFAVIVVSIARIYENRFNCFLDPRSWWCRVRNPAFFFLYALTPFFFLPPFFYLPDQDLARKKVLETVPCLMPFHYNDRPLYVLTLDYRLPFICAASEFTLFSNLILMFFVLTFWKMFVKKNVSRSERTMQLQKKFAIAMAIQAIFLLLVLGIPLGAGVLTILFWYHNQTLNNLLVICVCMHGIGSTIVMIVVHKPYRDFTFSKIRFLWEKEKPTVNCQLCTCN